MQEIPKTIINDEGTFEQSREWVLETEGTSMAGVMNTCNINIDFTRIISNDIVEIFTVCFFFIYNFISIYF